MRLEKVHLREIRLDLLSPFETSMGKTCTRRILLVEAVVDGVHGWGEVVAGEEPSYSYETIDTAWPVLREFIWPILRHREFASAADVFDILGHIRGHNMAKAGLESAIWDAEARIRGVSLSSLLGGVRAEIACGVSIGIQPTIDDLLKRVERELSAGYQRIKIKIKPGWDLKPVEALRRRWPQIRLMVDANSAYRLEDAPLLKALDQFYLIMLEQPLGYDDIFGHIELQKQLDTPICLDECINTEAQARAAIELGACRIINIKFGRVGGLTPAKRIHDLCKARDIPVWCGGMLESGIGRAQNVALSTLPNFVLPGDVSASRRYWSEDVISPEVEVTPQGAIRVPAGPGTGYEPRIDRIRSLTRGEEVLS